MARCALMWRALASSLAFLFLAIVSGSIHVFFVYYVIERPPIALNDLSGRSIDSLAICPPLYSPPKLWHRWVVAASVSRRRAVKAAALLLAATTPTARSVAWL